MSKHNIHIHSVRSAAGMAGAISRWQGVDHEPTVQVRVFANDADWLKAQPGTIAQNVRNLRKATTNVTRKEST